VGLLDDKDTRLSFERTKIRLPFELSHLLDPDHSKVGTRKGYIGVVTPDELFFDVIQIRIVGKL
jgi:hypothetical protein